MSDTKISQLTEETVSTDNDVYPVVENASGITKKVKNSTIKTYLKSTFDTQYLGLHSKADTAGASDTATTAANLSGTPALPNGTTATTQTSGDNSTKLATTSYVDNSDWKTSENATYVSADGSTGVFNITSDVTSKYSPGMRYKYQQDQALTAYWTFNTNSNSDVGSFNGTDTAMSYTAGKFGNAATFNGTTSKIVIADNAALKPTGEFTIGCWFKTGVAGTAKTVFQSYSQNTNRAGFICNIDASSNTLNVLVGKNTGTVAGTDYTLFTGTTVVTDNAWHYAVISFRNNYLQYYIDGKLESSGYCLTPAYAATNYFRVGCRNNAASDIEFFNGQIDDLFLINGYALDEATIKAKYAAATAQGTGAITVQKYGLITAVGAYAGGVTPITIWGGTDYSLANATISNPYYATVKSPFGFNTAKKKWQSLLTINASTTNPTVAVANNLASVAIPIGEWEIILNGGLYIGVASAALKGAYVGLSTSSSAFTDTVELYFFGRAYAATSATLGFSTQKQLGLTTKTTYYLLSMADDASITTLSLQYCVLRAVSTLL